MAESRLENSFPTDSPEKVGVHRPHTKKTSDMHHKESAEMESAREENQRAPAQQLEKEHRSGDQQTREKLESD